MINISYYLAPVCCTAALAISIYPGMLNDLALRIAVILAIVLILWTKVVQGPAFILRAFRPSRGGAQPPPAFPWRRLAILVAMVVVTSVLLDHYVPRRLAFAASQPAFENELSSGARPGQRMPLGSRLGLYTVDEVAADVRGGVYFRVYVGPDGQGPDHMSYGFVHSPNDQGTPFGAARYKLFPLRDGWYWFKASDDRY